MNSSLDIGIIGAGTAGLAAAIALARTGHRVTVFEKHAALATFGAGLLIQPQGVSALDALGVGADFERVSVPVDRLIGHSHRHWCLVDVRYDGNVARGVSRPRLAEVLFSHALAAGVTVQFSADIRTIARNGSRGGGVIDGQSREFDLVVLADGAGSGLREEGGLIVPSVLYRWGALWGLFAVDDWPEQTWLMQRFRGTREMMGLMPTERRDGKLWLSFFWSLKRDQLDAWRAVPLEPWLAHVRSLWPESAAVLDQIHSHEQLTPAQYRRACGRRTAIAPFCVIGDAAHAMSPQLGLGSTLAVQDGLQLALSLRGRGVVEGLRDFLRKRQTPTFFYQSLSRALTPCFQAQYGGWVRDAVFAGGRTIPGVPWMMKRAVAEPIGTGRALIETELLPARR